MESSGQMPLSGDADRYSRKLWRYWEAFEALLNAMQTIEKEAFDKSDFEKALQGILSSLIRASNSEIAFCADAQGKIRFAAPEASALVGTVLPPTQHVKQLLESGDSLVVDDSNGLKDELRALGVHSLLVARLDILWDRYFVGVCNGRDDPLMWEKTKSTLEH